MPRHLPSLWVRVVLALLAGSAGLWAGPAWASVTAYDGINYTAWSALNAQNGGFGWSNPYSTANATSTATIVKGSLPFGGLAASGNAFQTVAATVGLTNNLRTLGTTLGADGTIAYLGFLIKPTEAVNAGGSGSYAGLRLGSLFIGKLTSGFYGVETAGGTGRVSSATAPVQDITAFLVLRITFQAGVDKIELFVNPTPGQALPATADATKTDLDLATTNAMQILADHAVAMDEIRLGTTFDDVAPTAPVPTSALLFQGQTNNQIALWYMLGTQVIGSQLIVPTPSADWQVVGTGDFNQDGKPDLVFQNQTSGQIAIWLMNGPYFLGGNALPQIPGTDFKVCGVADMDGDGKPDLIFQNRNTGRIVFWFMDGTNFAGGILLPQVSALSQYIVGVADFDFNGTADLLFQDQTSGQVGVWYMNRTVYTGTATLAAVPAPGWKVRAMADYNSDGHADLVFQNAASNQIAFWYLKDFAYIGGALVNPIPDSDYKIVAPR